MNSVLAIDPGNKQSAWLILRDGKPSRFGINENESLMSLLGGLSLEQTMVIEQVACMGMAVGAEVFETVFWSGRFAQAWSEYGGQFSRLKRADVKMHLCGNMRAKDGNIRQALIDKFGGEAAVGKKKNPGPLYGISKDVWSALAIAITYAETNPS